MSDWLSYAWYEFNFYTAITTFSLAWSFRSEGSRNVPQRGPVIIISNHQSYIDPLLVGMAVRRQLCYLARKTLFRNSLFGSYLRSVNVVPVDQDGVAKEGLKAVLDHLKDGKAVLVFPEGNRTSTGRIQPLRPGIQLLIKRSMCPVLPVGVAGAYESFPRTAKLPILSPLFLPATRGAVAASIGRPLNPKMLADLSREELLDLLHREIDQVHQRAEALRRKP